MEYVSPIEWAFAAAGLALVVALLVHAVTSACNLRIAVRGGQVNVSGPALSARRAAVAEFFREFLPGVRRAWVFGRWDGRRLRLHGTGLSPGEWQRLRNFLLTEL